MKMGTVKCKKCQMNSVRNIHNKCVYCGHGFPKEYHVSETEKSERLGQIEATTERLKGKIQHEKEREKKRKKEANTSAGINLNNGLF